MLMGTCESISHACLSLLFSIRCNDGTIPPNPLFVSYSGTTERGALGISFRPWLTLALIIETPRAARSQLEQGAA